MLGLAAVTALDANVGRAAALTLADITKRQSAKVGAEAEREDQRSATAAARTEADRPTLSPIAPDAFGPAALT
jgi:hypothetical protein